MIPIKTVNVLLQWCSKIILGCFLTVSISVLAAPYMTKKATLAASDASAFGGFGRSVAISGDGNIAIVGSDTNAAYIFKRNATGG